MTLKDFIRQVLVEIAEGVAESHEDVKVAGGNIVGSESREVQFDVAVTGLRTRNDEDVAGLEVWSPSVEPSFPGEQPNASVSRIKFVVQMTLPKLPEPIEVGRESSERKFAPLRGTVIPGGSKRSKSDDDTNDR